MVYCFHRVSSGNSLQKKGTGDYDLKEKEKKPFSAAAESGLEGHAGEVARRYELMDELLRGIRDGNEYQALQAMQNRNKLRIPGLLKDELTEWKYDLIQTKALIIQELRRSRVIDVLLDDIHMGFTQHIYEAADVEECRRIGEEMVIQFCRLNQLKAISSYSLLVQKILLTVDMDLSRTLTLQYFAENLNVNRSYLSNLFRREVGMTITDYVTDRRIRTAADLLQTTSSPVKTVAKQVGIMDVHYFSRLFKRKMGMPPSRYREEKR